MPTYTLIICDSTATGTELFPLSDDLYRLDDEIGIKLFAEDEEEADKLPRFGDIIRATTSADGALIYESVQAKGAYDHFDFMLPKVIMESPSLKKQMLRVIDAGGSAQKLMGGFLFVSIPKGAGLDIHELLWQAKSET